VADPYVVLSGVGLGESPRWHDGRLWLCDWIAGEILVVDGAGGRDVVARLPSFPFSIDWLPDGRLVVVCGHALQTVEADGTLRPYADLTGLSEFGWNEIVVDPRGNAYVNNVGFDLMGGAPAAPGIVAMVTAGGQARQVADDVWFPNGMAITPDGSTLLVAESYRSRLTAFAIDDDAGLSDRGLWADLDGGVPDGICLDVDGAVWYADVPHRRCVRVRRGGAVLQTVDAEHGCFACMLGGPDGATLFMLSAEWTGTAGVGQGPASGQVLAVEAPFPHAGRP